MQLIVYDGTDYSAPDTVTIVTENAAPVSNAGNDQTVDEGDTVTLSGLASTDPDDNIAGYLWKQTGGVSVTLSNSNGAEATFVAPVPGTDSETLTFQLTVEDADGLLDVDTCNIIVNRITEVDSDGDGVPDNQDAFPLIRMSPWIRMVTAMATMPIRTTTMTACPIPGSWNSV